MFQVRIHGRGGQGVVTAAELLSVAAFLDGLRAQAFPSFGSERNGAPIAAFCRIDSRPIRTREPIDEPDAVIVQDPTLLHHVDVFKGLCGDGYALINSSKPAAELRLGRTGRIVTVAATDIARVHLGRPLPNAALLGGFVALTEAVTLEALLQAIRQRFRGTAAEANCAAAVAAHDALTPEQEAAAHA